MPRLNEQERRSLVEQQITTLLDQAADPSHNDPMGITNILRAQLVAELVAKNETVKAAWDSAMADVVAVLERRIQQLQTKPYAVVAHANPGIYGHDTQGNSWATFQRINGMVVCDVCGATIDRGWIRGKFGETQIHACSEHMAVIWEKYISINEALAFNLEGEL